MVLRNERANKQKKLTFPQTFCLIRNSFIFVLPLPLSFHLTSHGLRAFNLYLISIHLAFSYHRRTRVTLKPLDLSLLYPNQHYLPIIFSFGFGLISVL